MDDETRKKFGLDFGEVWLQVVAAGIVLPFIVFLWSYPVSCTTTGSGFFRLKDCTNFVGAYAPSSGDSDEFYYYLLVGLIGTPLVILLTTLVRFLRRS